MVLQELCDRITGDEAWDLLAQLPAQLKEALIISPAALPLRVVFGTLREAVSWGELEDVVSQLDPGYADLLA